MHSFIVHNYQLSVIELCCLMANNINVAGINHCMTANVSHTVSLTSVSASFLDCNSSAAASSYMQLLFLVSAFLDIRTS